MNFFVLCFFFFYFVNCLPVKNVPPPTQVLDFLKQFGYLQKDKETSAALYNEDGLSETLKIVQKFGGIKETGKLDNATLKLMVSPRCGNPDVVKGKRSKRFTFGSDGWNKRHLTYFVANWSPRLGEETVARLIGKALNTWGNYGNLRFSRKKTPDADIIVSFSRGYHNDPYPFDGPGLVLAHAYFPNDGSELSGDIHFDDDEDWVETASKKEFFEGTDFYSVALHELGHSLGLGHSNDPNSVMFPYYKGDDDSLQLGQDDILGMYQLYVARPIKETTTPRTRPPTPRSPRTRPPHTKPFEPKWRETSSTYTTTTERYKEGTTKFSTYPKETWVNTVDMSTWRYFDTKEYPNTQDTNRFPQSTTEYPTRPKESGPRISVTINKVPNTSFHPTTPPPIPNICEGNVDSIAYFRGEIFVFKNRYIWRFYEKNRMMSGYPLLLNQMFPTLPEDIQKIDAAYQRKDGSIILFTGDMYWIYDGNMFIENSPRSIREYGIPEGIGGIDAVQNWGRNDKTYLYKGDRFWRYNEKTKSKEAGYPAHMRSWKGVPENLDAAMTWKDGKTYFFKKDLYWTLENDSIRVSSELPRSFTKEWLGC